MASARSYLVTGASRGIGRAVADRLARDGHHVIGLARQASGDRFPGELVPCDLADAEATAAALAELTRRHDVLGLVNNVGVSRPEPLDKAELGLLDGILALNLHPALQAMQALLPAMRAAKWGRVVNITSISALGARERTSYSAAKAALNAFTRSWALELAGTGITVNAVAPGPIATELFHKNNPPGSESAKRALASIPIGRLGQPEDVAAAAAFLLSADAGFITGQILYVDGGASVGKALS
jgi:NAD(P)-dependent dehydrogenase (short-subunit alcohol dehydrogenase family)